MFSQEQLLVKIAEMYYLENKTQSQISKELGIHRTTISRLLKQSREEGIVEITIKYDAAGNYNLEKTLESTFGLHKAIVVSTAKEMQKTQKHILLAQALGNYLETLLRNKMKIGFSWGETLSVVVNHIPNLDLADIICVPMIGGPSGKLESDYHVNTITYQAAQKLNGKALLIDSPAIPETKLLTEELLKNEFNQELLNIWGNLDVAITGIGSVLLNKDKAWQEFYGESIVNTIKKQEIVGDVVSRFYNIEGDHIENELDERLIGITIDKLRKCPYRIGVAESTTKVPAIIGALKGRYVNILVTTEESAREILETI